MQIKDLFNNESVAALADALQQSDPTFDREAFLDRVFDADWPGRELKQRIRHITDVLHDLLPVDYRAALDILRRAMPRVAGIVLWVFTDYVEVYGLNDWAASIPALEKFTQRMSAEFAIRPFIVRYPERTMAQMLEWSQHENAEVRRLASEGCRPRLPWGIRLQALVADPSPILPILERLKNDESESVRKSVANNLNDISKDHPDVVLEVLARWQTNATDEVAWIIGHALRTLVKKGHPGALALLGHSADAAVAVHNLTVEPQRIQSGESVTLSFDVESLADEPLNLVIDYVVYHMRANGTLSPKVFKLTKQTIQPGETLHIEKRHSFAPVTTRKYYPGQQALEPKINGQLFGRVAFMLHE
ncbi:MAG: DNA alkylation repair protein [Anaerolineae bacterium]|nr:DNA alkylation repair protein [Anaerolineae bacterium]